MSFRLTFPRLISEVWVIGMAEMRKCMEKQERGVSTDADR